VTFSASLALGVLLVAAGRILADARADFDGGAGVLTTLGFGAFLVCGYILSFDEAADDLLDLARGVRPDRAIASIFTWTLSAAAIGAWAWLANRSLFKRQLAINREEWLLPVMLLQCVVLAALGSRDWAVLIAWSFNLVLLGIAAMWMWRGCRESRLRPTVRGSLLLAAVVLARYLDVFANVASRGLGFSILGGIFLSEALYYR
jgi:hypothetical protein